MASREEATARMFAVLSAEVIGMVPRAIWDWPELGSLVDPADTTLQVVANRYEDRDATRDEVVEAAEHLRQAWRVAVERFLERSAQRKEVA